MRKNPSSQWMDDNGHNWTNKVSGANATDSGCPSVGIRHHDVAILDVASPTNVTYARSETHGDGGESRADRHRTDSTNEVREPIVRGKSPRRFRARQRGGQPDAGIVDPASHLRLIGSQSERQSLGDLRGIAWNAAGTKAYVTGMAEQRCRRRWRVPGSRRRRRRRTDRRLGRRRAQPYVRAQQVRGQRFDDQHGDRDRFVDDSFYDRRRRR